MLNFKKFIREEILDFQPYIPGKPIDEVKRELKLKKIYKLASNENSIGPSQKVIAKLNKSLKKISLYPDSTCYYLKKALSKKYGIETDMILVGNGSDEIIELIGKTFLNQDDEIIVSEHAFIRFKMAADLMGAKSIIIPMKEFRHDIISMAKSITKKTKLIFIANPNNPTGTYNTKSEFNEYFNIIRDKNLITVIDEAYFEYAKINDDYPDSLEYLKNKEKVIIIRTFSKMYALAGLRIGYAFADKEIIHYMDRIRPPFNVNILAQIAAEEAINDDLQIKKTLNLIKKEKEFLYTELRKIKITYIPSATNFIMIDVSPMSGKEIFEELLKFGIIVRSMDEYGFPHHIRVTIGKHNENIVFIKALKKVLNLS